MPIHFEPSKSGLLAEQRRLDVSAHNVANVSTDGFQGQEVTAQARRSGGGDVRVDTVEVSAEAQQAQTEAEGVQGEAQAEGAVTQPQNDVNVVDETVNQITAKAAFQANAKVIRAQDGTIGSLLDAVG